MEKTRTSYAGSDSDRQALGSLDKDIEASATFPAAASRLAPPATAAEPEDEGAADPSPAPIPDGGLDAWLQVFGSWVILVDTWGLISCFGVFQSYYETDMLRSSSSSEISWIGSVQGSLLMLVGVFSGPLYDAGYFRQLLWVGIFLIVFGQFMTSLCVAYWQVLLAQGFCTGIGMGLTFLPSTAILSQYFHKKRSLVLGISSTGSPLAGIIFPVIFSRLEPIVGFAWATRVIAFILLGISIIPLVFMHTRIHSAGKMRSIVERTALTDVPFVTFVIGAFLAFLTLYVPFFYIKVFNDKHGLSAVNFSPYLVTILNVGSVFGRVIPTAVADRLGSLNMLIMCTIISAVLGFGWLGIHNLGGLVVFALLYGGSSGGVVSLTPSVIVSLSPDMSRVGARMGMSFLGTGVAILVGTPIAGAILDGFTESEWLSMIGYAAAGLLLSSTLFFVSRVILYRAEKRLKA